MCDSCLIWWCWVKFGYHTNHKDSPFLLSFLSFHSKDADLFSDWSLVTGRVGGGGGRWSFTLNKRVAGGKYFSHAEGGDTNSIEVVLTWELELLAILKGAQKLFNISNGGGGGVEPNVLTCLVIYLGNSPKLFYFRMNKGQLLNLQVYNSACPNINFKMRWY